MKRIAIAFCVLLLGSIAQAQTRPPNLIIFYADDMGYGDAPFNGRKEWQTPNLDRLAKEGTVFDRWYTASPVCTPSRAALMTGRYGIHTSCIRLDTELPSAETTIAEALKPHGYSTALFGKWHLGLKEGQPGDPIDQGFDEFFGFMTGRAAWEKFPTELVDMRTMKPSKGYSDGLFTDHAVDYIKRKKDQPFFLYLAFNTPHGPMQADPADMQPFLGKFKEKNPNKPFNAMYAAMIERQDKEIGRVLKQLDDLNLADNTLILFSSDNGATFEALADGAPAYFDSNHPLRGQKRNLWEGGIREPTVMRWPGHIAAGQRSKQVIMMTDVFPTLLTAAGGTVDPKWKVDGLNVIDAIQSKGDVPQRTLFWEWRYSGDTQFAAMRGDTKLVITGGNKPEMYNIENDPQERINIADDNHNLAADLRKQLEAWMGTETPESKKNGEKNSKRPQTAFAPLNIAD